jgi:hypothetical protein
MPMQQPTHQISYGGNTTDSQFSTLSRLLCQICGKTSYQALDCFHRMDYAYQGCHPPTQLAAMVSQTNMSLEDQQWLADSGANAHITNELENLSIQEPFQGHDFVAVGNGVGLVIANTGSSTLLSSTSLNSSFKLKDTYIALQLLQIYCLSKNFAKTITVSLF